MRSALLVAVALALLAGAGAPRVEATASVPARVGKSTFPPMLGISWHPSPPGATLAWFDPVTLDTLRGRKVPLACYTGSWAFSADRSVLAVAGCSGDRVRRTGIRFVNARTMRVLGDLQLSRFFWDNTGTLTWLRPTRLLAVVGDGRAAEAVLVDPLGRRILRREPLPSPAWSTGQTPDELVLLLGRNGSFAPARLAVIDTEGTLRIVTVDRIPAGIVYEETGGEPRARTMQPGLAVDPDGRRAFLVPASGPVAEVDLETLGVTYHALDPPSLLGRFLHWLTPTAQAKGLSDGPVRQARWLGNGLIAVSGADYSVVRTASGEQRATSKPAGLRLIDTRTWTTRMLEREASGFEVASSLVIADGGRRTGDADRGSGVGVRAFGLDGRERWHLHDGQYLGIAPAGPVGYIYPSKTKTEVVDLATGTILTTARVDEPSPELLATKSSGW